MLSFVRLLVFTGLILGAMVQPRAALENCGELYIEGQFGPYDYSDPKNAGARRNVDGHHFNEDVENLRKGESSYLGSDLHYTLRSFPNHYKALLSLIRYVEKTNADRVYGAEYKISCYFERAVQFKPDDSTVRLLYAKYLTIKKKNKEALTQLQEADKLAPDNANIKYNLGLAFFELKEYNEAATQAVRAYELGFSFPGLKRKLQSVGKWPAKGGN